MNLQQDLIQDEAHRVGADTWSENVKNLIRNSVKTKILAITATPKRTDDKQKDMMQEIAKMVYNDETILPDVYMAKEILVLDAMRDGIVTSPEVVDYAPALAKSEEYNQIRQKYETAKGKSKTEIKKVDAPFLIGAGLLLKGYINSINFIKAKVEEAKGEN